MLRTGVGSSGARAAQRYGVNRSQFCVRAGDFLRMFVPQHEPAAVQEQPEAPSGGQLRRRSPGAHARARRPHGDGHRSVPHACHARVPRRADLPAQEARPTPSARAGRGQPRRQGHAVHDANRSSAQAQILQQNLKAIGLEVEIVLPWPALFEGLQPRRTSTSPLHGATPDPAGQPHLQRAHDRSAGKRNWSYFDSPKYNRLLDQASRLPAGGARARLRRAGRPALERRGAGDPYRGRQRLPSSPARPAASSSSPSST